MSLLQINNLSVRFGDATAVPVVDGLDLSVEKGEVLAIVGESGSGKSVTMMALMGLIDAPGRITADTLTFNGTNMLKLSGRQRRKVVGKDIAMVFQDPMTALNPSYTVGFQIEEVLRLHLKMSSKQARKRAIELLEKVEIPGAASRMDAYPHQLSGGMSQRVAIAMAIAGEPKLLIADEPTTALDVTIQAQIMDLLVGLQAFQPAALRGQRPPAPGHRPAVSAAGRQERAWRREMTDFWSGYIIVLSLANIVGVAWLLMWTRKMDLSDLAEDGTTGHDYDGIREYNNPLPRWWLYCFWISIVFSLGYLALYPGLGKFPGLLGWTSHGELQADEAATDDAVHPAA
mgnify:CR=1 FL=1